MRWRAHTYPRYGFFSLQTPSKRRGQDVVISIHNAFRGLAEGRNPLLLRASTISSGSKVAIFRVKRSGSVVSIFDSAHNVVRA